MTVTSVIRLRTLFTKTAD